LGGGECSRGLGQNLAQRLAAAGESVVDVPPKLYQRGCTDALNRQCSQQRWTGRSGRLAQRAIAYGRSRGRIGSALRLLSERREDLVAERTPERSQPPARTLLLRDLVPGGVAGTLSTARAARTSCAELDRKAPRAASVGDWLRRSWATSGHWSKRSQT
jgi:hypothetical protein